jgi:spore maturation protein CgeB
MSGKLKHIDLFENNQSQYEVLSHFTHEFQQALHRKKIQSKIIKKDKTTTSVAIEHFAEKNLDCTAGFNYLIDEELFFEKYRIPHLALLVDFATYYPELILCPNIISAFADEDSVEFFKLFGTNQVLFFPRAIEREVVSEKLNNEIVNSERNLEVVLCSSFIDADVIYKKWQVNLSPPLVKLLDDITEASLASRDHSHIQATLQELQVNLEFAQEIKEKKISFLDVINSVEQAMRGRDKIRILNALHGHKVFIFGPTDDKILWERVLNKKNTYTFHKPVHFKDLFSVFKRSKIVINSMPAIKRGFHERLFMALAAGASVLTNDNVSVPMSFDQGQHLIYFLSPEYHKINQGIETALSNEKKRLEDVLKAREYIRDAHTWDARVKMLEVSLPPLLKKVKKQSLNQKEKL